jgi:hypothetical protein
MNSIISTGSCYFRRESVINQFNENDYDVNDDDYDYHLHQEKAIDCPEDFVPVKKTKPFYLPTLPPSVSTATASVVIKREKNKHFLLKPLLNKFSTKSSNNKSASTRFEREKEYRKSPRPLPKLKNRRRAISTTIEVTNNNSSNNINNNNNSNNNMTSDDSGTVWDMGSGAATDESIQSSTKQHNQNKTLLNESIKTLTSRQSTKNTAHEDDNDNDEDAVVKSFDRFNSMIILPFKINNIECLHRKLICLNRKFDLKPISILNSNSTGLFDYGQNDSSSSSASLSSSREEVNTKYYLYLVSWNKNKYT